MNHIAPRNDNSKTSWLSKRWRWWSLVAMVMLGILLVFYKVADVESNYFAYLHVVHALKTYVEKTDGKWPRDWEEFARFNAQQHPSEEWWLRSHPVISRRVIVRFDVTVEEVASMDLNEFTAVRPMGWWSPYVGHRNDQLQKAARKFSMKWQEE